MLTLDRHHNAPQQLPCETPPLSLRFDGLTLELKSGKNTIGSSPRCDIRIARPGVQPLHCLIIHQASETILRRWSGETCLNGKPTDEATLRATDSIQVGSARLDILGRLEAPVSSKPAQSYKQLEHESVAKNPPPSLPPAAHTASSQLEARLAQIEHLVQGRDIARERSRRLLQLGRRLRREHESLLGQVQSLRDELAERPPVDANALESLRQECESLRERDAELTNLVATYRHQAESADQLTQKARGEVQSLVDQKLSLTKKLAQLEADCDDHTARLEDSAKQIKSLGEERDHLTARNEQLTAEVDSLRQLTLCDDPAELDRLSAECNHLHAECELLRSQAERLPRLESELKEAVSERESASTELYRALLQLSELESSSRTNVEIENAQAALNAELDKSAREIAELQARLESLNAERETAELAREAVDRRMAELIESHQQIAYDKTTLMQEVSELRAQFEAATPSNDIADEALQELAEARARIQSLEDSLDAATHQADESRQALEDRECERRELNLRIAELTQRIVELEVEVENATSTTVEKSDSLASLPVIGHESDDTDEECVTTADNSSSDTGFAEKSSHSEETVAGDDDIELTPLLSRLLRDKSNASHADDSPRDEREDSSASLRTVVNADQPETVHAQPAQQASFIERYAHMFSDEPAADSAAIANAPKIGRSDERLPVQQPPTNQSGPALHSTNAGSDDEESIEDYMAKLLQRVRGDSSVAPIVPAPRPEQVVEECVESESLQANQCDASNVDFTPRRPTTPFPQTDLESLRALANESARRAISRHAVGKHRRNATTKLLIAVLATVASVFLMMGATDWSNPKFIAGAAMLLVAAYCTGETLRAWMQSRRVAASSESEFDIEELAREIQCPLPIDIEG